MKLAVYRRKLDRTEDGDSALMLKFPSRRLAEVAYRNIADSLNCVSDKTIMEPVPNCCYREIHGEMSRNYLVLTGLGSAELKQIEEFTCAAKGRVVLPQGREWQVSFPTPGTTATEEGLLDQLAFIYPGAEHLFAKLRELRCYIERRTKRCLVLRCISNLHALNLLHYNDAPEDYNITIKACSDWVRLAQLIFNGGKQIT